MENYTPRLLLKYKTEVINNLKKNLDLQNLMRLPRLRKIVLNMGLGNILENHTVCRTSEAIYYEYDKDKDTLHEFLEPKTFLIRLLFTGSTYKYIEQVRRAICCLNLFC